MRLVAAALFICAAATVHAAPPPPVWNPKAPDNRQLVAAFSINAQVPVLSAIGARAQRSDTDASRPALLVTFHHGRTALSSLSSCEATGCKALSIQSFWTKSAKAA